MANLNVVQRHNSLFNRIARATADDMSALFDDVKDFFITCKNVDKISAKRILDKYMEKFQAMLADNETAYNKKWEKLENAKNEAYDFSGEKDDTGAVQTMMLQLMGQLPKANNKANKFTITTTIDNALNSVVGCKAVLALAQYPAYADMVSERQRAKAVDGSKSEAQQAFEHAMGTMQTEYGKECAELYKQGFRLRTLNKRVSAFMRSVHDEEIEAANAARPTFWGDMA